MAKKRFFFPLFWLGLLLFLVIFAVPRSSFAQNTLPAGGEAIVAATPLSLGDYGNYSLPDGESIFYLIDEEVLPGQEVRVKVLFSGNTNLGVYFHDQDYQALTYKEYLGPNDNLLLYWLNGSQESQKYYLQIKNQAINEASLSLVNIEVMDRFDANSQADAGGTLDEALAVELGQYDGFLDFNYDAQDTEDYYRVEVAKGETLTAKATPPRGLYLDLAIYDYDGDEVVSDSSQDPGAAATGSIKAEKNGSFYVSVAVGDYGDDQLGAGQYELSLSGDLPDEGKAATANVTDSDGDDDDDDDGVLLAKPSLGKISSLVILVLVTILVIIVVTVFLLVGKKGKKGEPKAFDTSDGGKEVSAKAKETPEEEMVYCPSCGAKNKPGSKFCSKCGQKLT